MNHNTKIRNMAIAFFWIVSVLFIIFFIYMGSFENVSVYDARGYRPYTTMTGFSEEQIKDEAAPAGVHTVYRRTLDTPDKAESSLCFYVVHHYAQVYYDDELMYSLTSDSDNRIGGSIGSNWISVPIYPEDAGKELTIVVTPLFESVAGDDPQFLAGSRFSIMFEQLLQNIPQLISSILCLFVGIFIVAMQLYLIVRGDVKAWDMFFIGAFSVLLGLWQITGNKSSPILFSGNPMVLGYITIGVLFLCSAALLLFTSTYFHGRKSTLLWILSLIGSVTAAVVLLLQVLGVAEFKETLFVSHIMLLAAICTITAMALFHRKKSTGKHVSMHRSRSLLLLPVIGIVVDMAVFYVKGSSSDIFFAALIAFIVYALITFVSDILETTKKAYTDSCTGLTNKVHWNEMMNANTFVDESTAILMLDLNGLKEVNDTMGHDVGDRMIFSFANILRRSLPKNSVICRWGGDEFAVMITGLNKTKVEECMDTIRQAVDDYNATCDESPIFYAVGCAMSSDHPGLSHMELLHEADDQMYLNKRKWYSERQNTTDTGIMNVNAV